MLLSHKPGSVGEASWPRMRHLKLQPDQWNVLETNAIRQLSKYLWYSLTSLDLSCASLGAGAMSQLVLGKWPGLQRLHLSYDRLDTDAIAWLTQAHWQLE